MAVNDPKGFSVFDFTNALPGYADPFWWLGDTMYGRVSTQAKPGGGGGGGGGGGAKS